MKASLYTGMHGVQARIEASSDQQTEQTCTWFTHIYYYTGKLRSTDRTGMHVLHARIQTSSDR